MNNFDTPIERRGTHSYKWDSSMRLYGTEDVLPMWTADMDFRCAQPLIDAFQERVDHGIFGYTQRDAKYFDIIQNWLSRRFNWKLPKEAICWCPPGVIPALNFLLDALTEKGDSCIIHMPNYDSLFDIVEAKGRKLVTSGLIKTEEGYKIDFEDFEAKVKAHKPKVLIFCSPHNPTGRVWTMEELSRLAELCNKYDMWVISDEVHCDIVRNGVTHHPMGSLPEMAQRCVTMMSPNKSFNVAGLASASVFIQNEWLMAQYRKSLSTIATTLDNVFATIGIDVLYGDPECEKWLREVNAYIEGTLDYAVGFIKERIPEIAAYRPEGTYLMWLDFSGLGLEGDALADFLVKEAKLGLVYGHEFGPGCGSFARMNAACTRATMKEAMARLEKAVAARRQ
ncbi:MAG TPA: MalY/PatB family protein [Candidatus Acidoferrum sp.]|nr:MalY/PatB family protein [Candidatus Acidoferrum sp.]